MAFSFFQPCELSEEKFIHFSQAELDAHATLIINQWHNGDAIRFQKDDFFDQLALIDQSLGRVISLTSDHWKKNYIDQQKKLILDNNPSFESDFANLLAAEVIGLTGKHLAIEEKDELIELLIRSFESEKRRKNREIIFHLYALRWLASSVTAQQNERIIDRIINVYFHGVDSNLWTSGLQLGLSAFFLPLDECKQKQIVIRLLKLDRESYECFPRATGLIDYLISRTPFASRLSSDPEVQATSALRQINNEYFGFRFAMEEVVVDTDLRSFFNEKSTAEFVWECILQTSEDPPRRYDGRMYPDRNQTILRALVKITQFVSSPEKTASTVDALLKKILSLFFSDNPNYSHLNTLIIALGKLGVEKTLAKQKRDILFQRLDELASLDTNNVIFYGVSSALANLFPVLEPWQQKKSIDFIATRLKNETGNDANFYCAHALIKL